MQALTKDMLTFRGVTILEFVFFRANFNALSSVIMLKYQGLGYFDGVTPELRPTLITRCIVGTLNFALQSLAVRYLPLGIFFIVLGA